jgi:hypothetical protein
MAGTRETPFDESTAVSYNLNINDGPVDIKFFAGGKTNIAYNCLDTHILQGNGDKVAFYWEGNSVGEQTTCVAHLLCRCEKGRGICVCWAEWAG